MFNLESSIAEWRNQMLAAGIKSPVPLEELESHLRDEIQERIHSGLKEPVAFELSIRQVGQAEVLKTEFAKVGGTVLETLRRLFCRLAGIPDYQLATNMNIPTQNLEPRWTTYLKSFAFAFPALFIWVGALPFVEPKVKDICSMSPTLLPKPILLALAVSDLVRAHLLLGTLTIFGALIWLEWRSRRWPRYRRLVFGLTAFSLNLATLILFTFMMFFAVFTATNLLHTK